MKNKVLIVDELNLPERQQFFTVLKNKFEGNILIEQQVYQKGKSGTLLDLSGIDILFIHEHIDYSLALIQQAKQRNIHIVSYTGAEHISPWWEELVLHINDERIKQNLDDFLRKYFEEGFLDFYILEYGLEEAERRRQALSATKYVEPLSNLHMGLQNAFDLNKSEIFLVEETKEVSEDVFATAAKRVLEPNFWRKLETVRWTGARTLSKPIELANDARELLEEFAEILRDPGLIRRRPPEGKFDCGEAPSPCGECFLCQIEYHKGKNSRFYSLKEALKAFLEQV